MASTTWRHLAVLLCSVGLAAGCTEVTDTSKTDVTVSRDVSQDSGGDLSPTDPDSGDADVGTGLDVSADTPADPDVPAATAGFGEPCDEGAQQCVSGVCVASRDGKVCSRPCGSGCPTGWSCGAANVCYPDFAALCMPCTERDDCQAFGGSPILCIDYGAQGQFCGGDCTFTSCPEGWQCQGAQSEAGETLAQCVAIDAPCDCSPTAIELQAATTCERSNDFGTCSGVAACGPDGLSECSGQEPGPEICDGLDNDCDGATDNLGEPAPCEVANAFGTCSGFEQCNDGTLACDALEPAEDVCDGVDNNCDGTTDEGALDTDLDTLADCVDDDDDNDGVLDDDDNCPLVFNPDLSDADGDLIGDLCDDDDDNDSVPDGLDNCPFTANPGQEDGDDDGAGDLCDDDLDADTVEDTIDNCPTVPNPDQTDTDDDLAGDACDPDDDGDDVLDGDDNCPLVVNPGQGDIDNDDIGDLCDDDDDNDLIPNTKDNCPLVANLDQTDTDGDLIGNACDIDDDNDLDPDQTDCAPLDPNVHASATESCDTPIDDNCDTFINEEGALNCLNYYFDGDGDGFGTGQARCLCAPDGKYSTTVDGDCQDDNFAIHPDAAEQCNGVDDNCSLTADDGDISQMCGSPANATAICTGTCVLSCNATSSDLNESYSDGCECSFDTYDVDGDGNACAAAVPLGNLPDTGATLTVSGTLHALGDVDWFTFQGVDTSPNGPNDDYDVRIDLSANPADEFRFDIYRGGCSTAVECSNEVSYSRSMNFNDGAATGEGDCAPAPGAPGRQVCNDDTDTYTIRVFRKASAAPTCSTYQLTLSNAP